MTDLEPEPQRAILEQLVYSLPRQNGFSPTQMFIVCIVDLEGEGGYIIDTAMTPMPEAGISTGRMRDIILPGWRPGRAIMFIAYSDDPEHSFDICKRTAMMVPEVPVVEVIWSNGKEWAWHADPSTRIAFGEVEEIELKIGKAPPILQATDRIGNVMVDINFAVVGRDATPMHIACAKAVHEKYMELEPGAKVLAAQNFLLKVFAKRDSEDEKNREIARRLMITFGGVYLSGAMPVVVTAMKATADSKSDDLNTWWTDIAVNGVQEYSRPIYAIAASGWDATGTSTLSADCRERGFNEDELAELARAFEEDEKYEDRG